MSFTIQNRSLLRLLFQLSLSLFIATSCSSNPARLKDWYAENYPSPKRQIQKERQKEPQEPVSDKTSPRSVSTKKENTTDLPTVHEGLQVAKNDHTGKRMGSLKIMKGSLEEPVDLKFAANSPKLSEYNVSSLIEGKLFKLVEDAYIKRDENEFTRLYKFFLDSFPQSGRKSYLEERWRTFFYSEQLDTASLKDGLVEVSYPEAKDLDEFNRYLAKLKSTGIGSIQLNMVQVLEQPIYLFAKPENPLGYYFNTPAGPLVDNLLDQITALAHANGLKVLITFPLRNHPMLGHQSIMLVDESWNSIQNRTTPNAKLDLLNPQSQIYLTRLIRSLMASKIDGIVFKDDFTHEINEGFSAVAQHRYLKMTGRTISFNSLFVPVKSSENSRFEILTDEAFNDIAVWRTREVKQLLWDLIADIRKQKDSFILGIEVTPEMVLQENLSVKWYSTGLSYLKDLDLDLFVLKWRKSGSDAESDIESYRKSAWRLRDSILPKASIYMKVPLSAETNNVIRLNRRIRENVSIQQDMKMTKLAVGPVSRLKQLDFLSDTN
ncbi:MAG: hypothetical protein HOK67_01450 [Deltaproteobacteria bacterium]|jgi:hypothetical protein|nr:hypothetical protein [Deltaproteobacteria bacterium]MBT4269295.1 hypothetical protein [Deltaproteobacteria bacterium]MBT4643267.1 hypothetical protein [Deltaproteobacteria bacterium]MBT6498552.1 hypothetical protein [Deltaproteobacteria bacterium]MBT6615516.1 hypothetical protein [Deltaproteobacteria bacterium]